MSLIDRGTEVVTVFPEETVTDADGNTMTRPSAVGVVARAVVQPMTSTTRSVSSVTLSGRIPRSMPVRPETPTNSDH